MYTIYIILCIYYTCDYAYIDGVMREPKKKHEAEGSRRKEKRNGKDVFFSDALDGWKAVSEVKKFRVWFQGWGATFDTSGLALGGALREIFCKLSWKLKLLEKKCCETFNSKVWTISFVWIWMVQGRSLVATFGPGWRVCFHMESP